MDSKSQKGQLLVELLIAVLVLVTSILMASQILITARTQNKKYDSFGSWRNYGKN